MKLEEWLQILTEPFPLLAFIRCVTLWLSIFPLPFKSELCHLVLICIPFVFETQSLITQSRENKIYYSEFRIIGPSRERECVFFPIFILYFPLVWVLVELDYLTGLELVTVTDSWNTDILINRIIRLQQNWFFLIWISGVSGWISLLIFAFS